MCLPNTTEMDIENKHGLCGSTRFYTAILTILGIMLMYMFRASMGVAIVCMTQPSYTLIKDNNGTCNTTDLNGKMDDTYLQAAEFDYDKKTQGLILGSFFWAYFVMPLPSGWLAGRFGGKKVFGWSVFLCSLLSLITPLAARTNLGLLVTSRALTGLFQGSMWPSNEVIWSKWAPPLERTILGGLSVSGLCFGTMLGLPLSAVLCTYGFDRGWPSCFYVFGIAGMCWFLVWMLTVHDTPLEHPRISEQERNYIVDSLKAEINVSEKVTDVPFFKMLRSMPVWSVVLAIACTDWGSFTFLFDMPSYMEEIHHFNVLEGGMYSAIPFAGLGLISVIASFLPDYIRRKQHMSTVNVRKLFHSIGAFVPAIFLILAAQFDSSPTIVICLLTIGLASSGCVSGGISVANSLDIAGRYAGIVMGMAMVVVAITGVLAPLTIGFVTVDETREQWQTVFYIAAAVYVFGGIFYLIFAAGHLQPWAQLKEKDKDLEYQITTSSGQCKSTQSLK